MNIYKVRNTLLIGCLSMMCLFLMACNGESSSSKQQIRNGQFSINLEGVFVNSGRVLQSRAAVSDIDSVEITVYELVNGLLEDEVASQNLNANQTSVNFSLPPASYFVVVEAFDVTKTLIFFGEQAVEDLLAGENRRVQIDVLNVSSNQNPVANAGVDQNFLFSEFQVANLEVILDLDGSASFDPNPSDVLSYQWSFLNSTPSFNFLFSDAMQSTTAATFEDFSAQPTEFPLDQTTTVSFLLEVSDNQGGVSTDTVTYNIFVKQNEPPVVDLGADQNIVISSNDLALQTITIALDGSGTSDDFDLPSDLTYQWSEAGIVPVPLFFFSNDSAPVNVATFSDLNMQPSTFPPGQTTTISFELEVTDSEGEIASDTVDINIFVQP